MPQIIDSHVHFWNPTQLRYPWLDNLPTLNRPFLTDHVPTRVNELDIEGIVFVQADCLSEQALAEVDFVTELAANDARVRGIVAFAPLAQGVRVRWHLDTLKTKPLVKGVRQLIQDEPAGFATRPDFVAGSRMLAEYGFSSDLCIRHHQLGDLIQLVRQCPEVNFVLAHVGKPDIHHHVLEPWRAELAELARSPNVCCKISGMVTEADVQNWTAEDLKPYVEHVINVFGMDRVMFGSDAPVLYLAATYERWVTTLQALTQDLSASEQQKLWHDNAARVYRLTTD